MSHIALCLWNYDTEDLELHLVQGRTSYALWIAATHTSTMLSLIWVTPTIILLSNTNPYKLVGSVPREESKIV